MSFVSFMLGVIVGIAIAVIWLVCVFMYDDYREAHPKGKRCDK